MVTANASKALTNDADTNASSLMTSVSKGGNYSIA